MGISYTKVPPASLVQIIATSIGLNTNDFYANRVHREQLRYKYNINYFNHELSRLPFRCDTEPSASNYDRPALLPSKHSGNTDH